MSTVNIVLVSPPGYAHALALLEIGQLLFHSAESVGHRCMLQVNTFDRSAVNVVLGYHLIDDPSVLEPLDVVVYQLEQLSEREGWFDETRLAVLRQARAVWDYSTDNVAFLRDRGVDQVSHLPIGFHERLRVIAPVDETSRDVDVLFYGSINERRQKVLNALAPHCRLKTLFGVYGEERDAWIARSKIVLNIHHYERQIMEQVRIAYLFNNERFVLSESSPVDPYGSALTTAPYEELVDTCRQLLAEPDERESRAARGYEHLRRSPMTDAFAAVLPASRVPLGIH